MTHEEFQQLILEELKTIKATMATQEDIAKLPTQEDIAKLPTQEDIAKLPTQEDIAKLPTQEDIAKLPTRQELYQAIAEQQKDIIALFQIMDKKLSIIQETQTIQGESINILAFRQLQTEAEVATLKKAK